MRVARPRRRRDHRARDRARPRRVGGGRLAHAARPRRRARTRGRRGARRRHRDGRRGGRRRPPGADARRSRATGCCSTPRATGSTSRAMDAALAAHCGYVDLGGLYHVTARPAAPARRSSPSRACSPSSAAAPGPARRTSWPPAPPRSSTSVASVRCASAGLDEDPPPGLSLPYALDTLLDELTVRAGGRCATARPSSSSRSPTAGEIDFPDPIGRRASIHTLHSEVLTLGDSLGARRVDFRLSLAPAVLDALTELAARPREELRGAAPAPPSARTWSAQHVEVTGSRAGAPARATMTALTVPARGLGRWAAASSPRRRSRPPSCPALRARFARRGRGHAPARARAPPRRALRRARAARLRLRLQVTPLRSEVHGMKVGVPTEIKADEYRVALTPVRGARARRPRPRGRRAGRRRARARRSPTPSTPSRARGSLPDADAVFAEADLIVKVKEPQPEEVARLEPRHTLFTYLHLAPDPELTQGLIDSGATCIAYETVEDRNGRLPLLAPMSEVAGKIATQAGAFMLEKPLGGRGILLGGVPGVAAAQRAWSSAAAWSGMNAAFIAIGMEADRLRLRPQHRPPARARHHLRRPRRHVLRLDARRSSSACPTSTWSSAPSSSTARRRRTSSRASSSGS